MTGGRQPPDGPAPSRVHALAGLHRLDLIAEWIRAHPGATDSAWLPLIGLWGTEHLVASILDAADYKRGDHDRKARS